MSNYPSKFSYSPEQASSIRVHFKRLGKDNVFEVDRTSLEASASWYLFTHAWSEALPDKEGLERRQQSEMKFLRGAQELMSLQCGPVRHPRTIPQSILDEQDDEKIRALYLADVVGLFERLARGEMDVAQFTKEMGIRALDDLITLLEGASVEARRIRDDGKKKTLHRRTFIENICVVWAKLNDCDLCSCTVSHAEGTPMLEFIKACLQPLTDLTEDACGDRTIMNTVNDIKRERSLWIGTD